MKKRKVQKVDAVTQTTNKQVPGRHDECTKEEDYEFLDDIDFLQHIDLSDYEGDVSNIENESAKKKEDIKVNVDYLDDLAFFDELDYFEQLNKSLEEELKELDTRISISTRKTGRRWIKRHSEGILLGAGVGVMILLSGIIISAVRLQLSKTSESYAVTTDTRGVVTATDAAGSGKIKSMVTQEEKPVETPRRSESLIQKRKQPKAAKINKNTKSEGKIGNEAPERELKEYFSDSVFIGNSLIEGLQVAGGVSTAKYMGVKSLSVTDAINKPVIGKGTNKQSIPQALSEIKCKKIFVMFGVNELGWPYPKVFGERYAKLIKRLQEVQPEATIYIQSILPCTEWLGEQDKECKKSNIKAFNKVIEDVAKETGCEYLDVGPAVANSDGYLPDDAAIDGMHLRKSYNRNWISYIYNKLK